MSFFEFPHTRTYDSDLGWLIKKMKEIIDDVAQQNTRIDNKFEEQDGRILAVEQLAAELKAFVNNYFDNLDVQQEINNKIDEMAANGDLLALLEEPVTDIVAAWLAAHITPTTPPVDNTLTISGAAADAKVAGDRITELKNDFKDNFNLIKIDGFVAKKYIITNVNVGSTVDLTESSSNGYSYVIFDCSPGDKIMITGQGGNNPRLWAFVDDDYKLLAKSDASLRATALVVTSPTNTAHCIINSETSSIGNCYITPDWKGTTGAILSTKFNEISSSIPTGADLNDYITPGNYYVSTYAIGTSLINAPIADSGRLVVMTLNSNSNIFQSYITVKGKVYVREKDSNGWSAWSKLAELAEINSANDRIDELSTYIISNTYNGLTSSIPSESDINDYTTPGNFYVSTTAIAQSLSNMPVSKGGRLIVMSLSSQSAIFQIYIDVDGIVYTRKSSNAGWSEWNTPKDGINVKYEDASSISSGSDLNDYTTPGNYYVSTNAIASSLTNIPVSEGGRLTVMSISSTNALLQIYISVSGVIYTRRKDLTGWYAWDYNADGINVKYEDAAAIPSGADLNDYTQPGNYYVRTTAIATSLANAPLYLNGQAVNSGGRLLVMTLNSTNSILQIYTNVKGEIFTRKKDASNWTYWEQKISEADTSNYASRAAYNYLQAIIAQSDYDMAFANAFTPLSLKNYLSNTQNVHPKVLYFENGFGGHKYWMAYTPYPYSDDVNENPCVAYSDDGYAWKNISGNPLDVPADNGYNSDTHLVYRDDTGVLELWYRYFNRDTENKIIYRRTTTDGVTWTQKEVIKTFSASEDCASPAIIWDGTNYLIWGVSAGTTIDFYTVSPADMSSWTFVRTINLTYYDNNIRVYPWHIDVIKDGDTYILLAMTRNTRQVSDGIWSLFIATSIDNIDYGTPVKVVSGADGWDKYMYRSSIVKVGAKYRIYYSACNTKSTTSIYNNAYWGIGITESDNLTAGYVGKYE